MLPIYFTLVEDDDVDLFEKIYNEYEYKLFGLSLSKLHDKSLSEEAVSETFLALAKNFKKVNNLSMTEILAYTVIINRNICCDIAKNEKKHKDCISRDELDELKENESFDEKMDKILVANVVDKLPDPIKDVVMLKYYYGLSYIEIADALKISKSSVKVRLRKAKELLSEELM